MNWNENDLKIVDVREKIILLTNKFNEEFGRDINNYHTKLERYINRRLKMESTCILREQMSIKLSSLANLNKY